MQQKKQKGYMREEPEYHWKDTLNEIKGGVCNDDNDDDQDLKQLGCQTNSCKNFIITLFLAVLTVFGIAGIKLIHSFY